MAQIGALRAIFDSVPSLHVSCLNPGPGGGIGRRYGLKIRFANASASSSLAPGTMYAASAYGTDSVLV